MSVDKIINDIIYKEVNRQFEEFSNLRMMAINKKLTNLQQTFFKILVQKNIGVTGAPDLGAYTPTWKPLSKNYTQKRFSSEHKVPRDQFFIFTGKLKRSLSSMKATTRFGTPVAELLQSGTHGRKLAVVDGAGRSRFVSSGRFAPGPKKLKDLKNIIRVDLYPLVTESLKSGRLNEAKYLGEENAMKITNEGKRNRPFMVQFMNWWLHTKARHVIAQELK